MFSLVVHKDAQDNICRDHMSIPSIDDGLKQHHNNRLQYDDDEDRSSEVGTKAVVKRMFWFLYA